MLPSTPPRQMDNDAPRIGGPSPEGSGDRNRGNHPDVSETLLAAFAHELRNALGPVRTAAYLLRASVREDAHAQWALDLIDRQVNSIAASIEELADVVRVKRGTLELESDSVDLGEALDVAASACAAALAERRQTLDWTRPSDQVAIKGDRARLVQALTAVLRTTSRIAVAGSRISVRMDRARSDAEITIAEISDTKPGAARGDADSADAPPLAPAASVGVTLAQWIVALHGGSLTTSSRSRFSIRLPLAG